MIHVVAVGCQADHRAHLAVPNKDFPKETISGEISDPTDAMIAGAGRRFPGDRQERVQGDPRGRGRPPYKV